MLLARSVAVAALLTAACSSGSPEEGAYEVVKAQAARDLGCEAVVVKKMAQLETRFEYEASGCDDVYSYGVVCDGRCTIVAGNRGHGVNGAFSLASSRVDTIVGEMKTGMDEHRRHREEVRARQEKVRAEIDAMRAEHDRALATDPRLQKLFDGSSGSIDEIFGTEASRSSSSQSSSR